MSRKAPKRQPKKDVDKQDQPIQRSRRLEGYDLQYTKAQKTGRELVDEKIRNLLRNERVQKKAKKGRREKLSMPKLAEIPKPKKFGDLSIHAEDVFGKALRYERPDLWEDFLKPKVRKMIDKIVAAHSKKNRDYKDIQDWIVTMQEFSAKKPIRVARRGRRRR